MCRQTLACSWVLGPAVDQSHPPCGAFAVSGSISFSGTAQGCRQCFIPVFFSWEWVRFALVYFKPHFLRYDSHRLEIIPFVVQPCIWKMKTALHLLPKSTRRAFLSRASSLAFRYRKSLTPSSSWAHTCGDVTREPACAAIWGLVLSLGMDCLRLDLVVHVL